MAFLQAFLLRRAIVREGSFDPVGWPPEQSSRPERREGPMPDLLIRDVPREVLAGLDANARRRGLSRDEYVRRRLTRGAARYASAVRVADPAALLMLPGSLPSGCGRDSHPCVHGSAAWQPWSATRWPTRTEPRASAIRVIGRHNRSWRRTVRPGRLGLHLAHDVRHPDAGHRPVSELSQCRPGHS